MLEINVSKNFDIEIEYITETIFKHCLGLNYRLNFGSGTDYVVTLPNKKQVIFENHFFHNYEALTYLSSENIPKHVKYVKNKFIPEGDIPIIFGTDSLNIDNDKIICGVDIFASAFFMLTRWEEYVNKTRDNHDRFPANESLAYRCKFLMRPVVNEYVEMLWNMLVYMGYGGKRKPREFKIELSHDVDRPLQSYYLSFKNLMRVSIGDIIKRKSPFKACIKIYNFLRFKFGLSVNDPYDTFDFLMSTSEKYGLTSNFFFLTDNTNKKFDAYYKLGNKKIRCIIEKIRANGHNIGLHSSYETYVDEVQTKKEYDTLCIAMSHHNFQQDIIGGRQHYLRFSVPHTWQNWENAGLSYDSTLGYADHVGFRCGTCYEFPVFNFLTRKKLALIERPLIVMEQSLLNSADMSLYRVRSSLETTITQLVNQCKKYKGTFTLLWHNSSLECEETKKMYEKILFDIKNLRAGNNKC